MIGKGMEALSHGNKICSALVCLSRAESPSQSQSSTTQPQTFHGDLLGAVLFEILLSNGYVDNSA